jgi:hypothetical protein
VLSVFAVELTLSIARKVRARKLSAGFAAVLVVSPAHHRGIHDPRDHPSGSILAFEVAAQCASGKCSASGKCVHDDHAVAIALPLYCGTRLLGTGGKVRQNGLSKKGDRYLRSLLVNGAMAVVQQPQIRPERHPWVT